MTMPFLFKSLGLTKPATLGSTLADMKCSFFYEVDSSWKNATSHFFIMPFINFNDLLPICTLLDWMIDLQSPEFQIPIFPPLT